MTMILVAGEALIDFLQVTCNTEEGFVYRPGGSPYNVAVGLARLGLPVAFLGAVSTDPFGKLLLTNLRENHVKVEYVFKVNAPTALSFVMYLDKNSEPKYLFYGQGTADTQLSSGAIPPQFSTDVEAIHVGSLAMVREPCATALTKLLEREHQARLISFDPNIRPEQMPNQKEYRKKFARWLPMIDFLKLSRADLSYIAPRDQEEEVAREWLSQGPKVIVVTLGQEGARAYTHSATVEVKAQPVEVVDTVGAGDAFTAGFLAALYYLGRLGKQEIEGVDEDTLRRALKFAARAAALTCTKRGADPPWLSELGKP